MPLPRIASSIACTISGATTSLIAAKDIRSRLSSSLTQFSVSFERPSQRFRMMLRLITKLIRHFQSYAFLHYPLSIPGDMAPIRAALSVASFSSPYRPQHNLYFFPLPQRQGSFLPVFSEAKGRSSFRVSIRTAALKCL